MKGYNSLKEVRSQYPIGYIVFPNTKPPLSIVGYFFMVSSTILCIWIDLKVIRFWRKMNEL